MSVLRDPINWVLLLAMGFAYGMIPAEQKPALKRYGSGALPFVGVACVIAYWMGARP